MGSRYLGRPLFTGMILIYFLASGIFYGVAKHQLNYRAYDVTAQRQDDTVGEIIDGKMLCQQFAYGGDYIREISVMPGTYGRKNRGTLHIALSDGAGKDMFWQGQKALADMEDNTAIRFAVEKELDGRAGQMCLLAWSEGCQEGNAVTLYCASPGDSMGSLMVWGSGEGADTLMGKSLFLGIYGDVRNPFGSFYWLFALSGAVLAVAFFLSQQKKEERGQKCVLHSVCGTLDTYQFLVKQLVIRDFKTKYKRSVLGALWSLLNPLCTMAVQYVVFSTIFKSSIRNYPAYLLSASVLFNFFTESVGGGLASIVGNAALITKVYVPKYIYPVTKVLSTSINLLISMLPLFAVVLATKEPVSSAYLLIPFVFVCLLVFCAGMSMMLAALMVFFRDMQFLWGIISLLWMYATPLFYPEEIIPGRFRFVLELNPMYHYISFFRTVLLEHVSPQLGEYAICMAFSLAFCVAGALFFGCCQKKFALYL